MGYGIPPNHAKYYWGIWEDLQPHHGVGTSMPSQQPNHSRTGTQAPGQQWQLGVHLLTEQDPGTGTSVQHGSHQCYSRWHPSTNACGWLHQLLVQKLLQCKDLVVCPEGLNGQMEASELTFRELSFWNATAASKPQLMVVDLGGVQPRDVIAAPKLHILHQSYLLLPQIPLKLLVMLQQSSSIAPAFISQHTKETAAICTLGALPAAEESEDPPGLKRHILSPQLQLWSSHQQSQSWCRHLCRCPFQLVPWTPPTSPLDPSSQPC